ncbi:MAG TPA: amino acid adenylation domain-containing protein, partial [Pyrinomonadaceae bacterium]|nr:amino acid adenylation domain-containing protein [Pyrinomonadaceae bacterium]
MPFEKLVEELQPERDPSRSPLFQVMLTLESTLGGMGVSGRAGGVRGEGLRVRAMGGEVTTAKFDLSLLLVEAGGGLAGAAEYTTDLFDQATVERMMGHLVRLLESSVEAGGAGRRVSELELLSEGERRQLLCEWNDTAVELPARATVHSLFEEQAARTPDALAVASADQRLTYAGLNGRANRLARHLRALGVGPEVLVGVCTERSVEMVVSLLAVLKAGGAYLPLDPAYPLERLSFMIEDAGAAVLLTREGLAERVPTHWAQVFYVDSEWGQVESLPGEDLGVGVDPSNLAYVIYTSGSTGRPKGVLIQHRGVCNLSHAHGRLFEFPEGSRVLQFASLSFDASVWEILMALLQGAALVCASEQTPVGPELVGLLREGGVTHATLPPSALAVMNEEELPALRWLITAGEASTLELMRRWSQGREHFNAYGPTETTVCATAWKYEEGSERVLIGRPITNTRVYLLDAGLRPVPVGVAGELYVSSAGLARGYLRRPSLTAERFIPHPFTEEAGARLYRTGDVARHTAGGELEYVGRVDEQVKVRGFRIELGEVRAALCGHASVRDALVLVREEGAAGRRLVAYATPSGEERCEAEELRRHLGERLPAYMVPAAVVWLEEFPLTPNGKVDRKALPDPERFAHEARPAYEPPRTPVEELLAGAWAQVLEVGRVGREDNFFDLGGHSLLATQLLSRVREALGVELSVRTLFEAPTVAALAEAVARALGGPRQAGSGRILPAGREGELPLSFGQQRLWFLDQLEPGSFLYNVPVAVSLKGSLDLASLERALTEIVRRHEVLRTSFRNVAGRPVQVIAEAHDVRLEVEELSALPEGEREAAARRRASAETRRPFDLSTGPLWRVKLLRLGAEEHVLAVTMHHIVSDGWSMGVLVNEVTTLYRAFVNGEPSPLPELEVQYADYAVWQRGLLQGEALEAELSYWREQLGGDMQVLELPTDRPRPAVPSYHGAIAPFGVSKEVTERLLGLTRRENATLFMTVLAGFQALLHRYSGQDDIVIGSPTAGRNRAEIEPLIGFFINTLVLRTDLSGEPTFVELMRRVKEVSLGAYAHQDVPFEKLVEELQPERDLSRAPLFHVVLMMQNMPAADAAEMPGLTLKQISGETGIARMDMHFSVGERSEGLQGSLEYNTDLFDAATVERMLAHLSNLFASAAEDAGRKVCEIELLSETERRQMLHDWNDTSSDFPRHLCVHHLFEQQAARTPLAPALFFEGAVVSYAELNAEANRLARHLLSLGVGPDVLVGLCVERSVEMVVALLAVLKAGGAYLPLDPEYPSERLAFMLEDANVPLLLTQERLLDRLPSHWGFTLCLDTDRQAWSAEDAADPATAVTPANLAYVIYTSGSTGRPKGVLVEHSSLVSRLTYMRDYYGLGEGDRHLQFVSFGFDVAAEEVFAPLSCGAAVVAYRYVRERSPAELLAEAGRDGVTKWNVPASYWHRLVDELAATGRKVPPSLRLFGVGGEAASAEKLRAFARMVTGPLRFYNAYGPTEATIVAANFDLLLGGTDLGGVTRIPVGRPVANARLYVADAHLRPVPAGVVGELYIGGEGVARGYLSRPGLTAERFVPDPFSEEAGARLYRTGDLARHLSGGEVEFVGRADNQVKVRGYRVELGEVEAALASHPSVREAAVLALSGEGEEKRLVGYVVGGAEGARPKGAELRQYLQGRLPGYMVPSAVVVLDEMPRTPNGKLDRRALPEPESLSAEEGEQYEAPLGEVEELLAGVFAQVLRMERVGRADNFFESGGHSLLATQIISRLRD